MSQAESTARTLETLSAELLALDAGDKDEIARLGAAMEGLLDNPGLSEELKGLVSLSLQVMQRLYEQTIAVAAMDDVAMAIASVREHLSGPPQR